MFKSKIIVRYVGVIKDWIRWLSWFCEYLSLAQAYKPRSNR